MSTFTWAALGVGGVAGMLLATMWRRLPFKQGASRFAAPERSFSSAEPASYQSALDAAVIERTQALQAALRACEDSDRFLRSIADKLPNFVSYWDLNEVCHFANQGYLDLFGVSWAELHRTPWSQLIVPDQVEANHQRVAAVYAGKVQQYERVREFKGRPVRLWVQMVPDTTDGQVRGFFVIATDVTPMKEAEHRLHLLNEQLIQARDHAEAANRAKSAFLANMSHEIRTPMNAIIGLTHLMQRDSREPTQVERLGKVTQAASHLLEVINDVLDLSTIESGELELEHTDFELSALISRLCALVGDRARAKGLALVVERGPDVPDSLHGDPTRVSQALLNLATNAVKFTETGSVLIRTSVINRDAARVHLRFTVQDTGIGVPADKLPTLFSVFEQVDGSITRRFGGIGLGLAITRRLAQLMGGDVGVNSVPGQGSEFWLSCWLGLGPQPVASNEAPQPQGQLTGMMDDRAQGEFNAAPWLERRSDDPQQKNFRGRRVLLAEDNLVNQEVACEVLTAAGLAVDLATDGQEAVDQALKNDYDLILMDVQMPELDGLEATQRIRRLPRHASTPIVAMTASVFGDDRRACIDAGMNDHIAKPLDIRVLFETMARWLPDESAQRAPAPGWVEAPASSSCARLDDVPGLNIKGTLLYMPGRQDIIERVLRQFCEAYRDGVGPVCAQIDSRKPHAAARLLHALRGAAGAVGAVDVQVRCKRVEQALLDLHEGDAAGEAPRAEVQALGDCLAQLVGELDARLGPAPVVAAAACSPADQPSIGPGLQKLTSLLHTGDFQASVLYREMEPQLRGLLDETATRALARAMRALDYEGALAVLQARRQLNQ